MTQTLTQRLQNEFIGKTYDEISITDELTRSVGLDAMCDDSGIDDGINDDIDTYLLYASYMFKRKDIGYSDMVVIFYFGDRSRTISMVDVRNPIDSKESKQKEIKIQLEKLVHKRFNVTTLTTTLESIFNENISLISDYEDKEDQADWNFTFGTTKDVDTKGVFDIYYLEQRINDSNNNTLYVTEVGYLFD